MRKLKLYLLIVFFFTLGYIFRGILPLVLAHGGDTNLIHGCIRPLTGLLRIIGASDTCGTNETPLDWNKSGIGEFGGYTTDQLIGLKADQFSENFAYRYFQNANFSQSDIGDTQLDGADFTNANFTNTVVSRCSAIGVNFTNVNFTGSGLSTSNFQNANFTNANLTNASLQDSNMDGTIRTGVIWSNTTCPDGTNSDDNGGTCEGHL